MNKYLPEIWQNFLKIDHKIQSKYHDNSTFVKGVMNHVFKEKVELLNIGRRRNIHTFFNRLFNQDTTLTMINIPILIMEN